MIAIQSQIDGCASCGKSCKVCDPKRMRNIISTTFSQQILCGWLLLVVIEWQKSNLSNKFKLKLITTFSTIICCKTVMDVVALL